MGELALTVKGPSGAVRLSIDGRELPGSFPANQLVRFDLGGYGEGPHRLVAAALDTSSPRAASRALFIDRNPRLLSVRPPPGAVTTGEPLAVEATFSSPVVPALAAAGGPSVLGPGRVPVPARLTVLPDGVTVRIETDRPLDLVGAVEVSLSVRTSPTSGAGWTLGTWYAPDLAVAFLSPAAGMATNGTVDVAVNVPAGAPALELRAGDRAVGTLAAPAWSIRWNTASVAEGTWPLTLRARGYHVVSSPVAVTVDRTAPVVTSCRPEWSPADDMGLWECFVVTTSEPVVGVAPALLAGGITRPASGSWSAAGHRVICPQSGSAVPLPAAQSLDLGRATDLAGNPLAPFTCQAAMRAWHSPCGGDPVSPGGVAARAREVAMANGACELLWIGAGGDTIHWASWGPAGWETRTAPTARGAGSALSGLTWGAARISSPTGVALWNEVSGVGWSRQDANGAWGPSSLLGAYGSVHPASAASGEAVAWAEPTPQGGRAIRVNYRDQLYFDHWWLAGGPAGDPAATADQPVIAGNGVDGLTAAWVETPAAGGPAQLRAAQASQAAWTWPPVAAVRNADPGRAASEPALWAPWLGGVSPTFLAWAEGGQVMVQRLDAPAPASVMNADPARSARMPRFFGLDPFVVFVETGPSGDEIRARRWDGAAWVLVPEIANAGVPGAVAGVAGSASAGFAWIDAGGAIRMRAPNR